MTKSTCPSTNRPNSSQQTCVTSPEKHYYISPGRVFFTLLPGLSLTLIVLLAIFIGWRYWPVGLLLAVELDAVADHLIAGNKRYRRGRCPDDHLM